MTDLSGSTSGVFELWANCYETRMIGTETHTVKTEADYYRANTTTYDNDEVLTHYDEWSS
jgi:hypothetical protein